MTPVQRNTPVNNPTQNLDRLLPALYRSTYFRAVLLISGVVLVFLAGVIFGRNIGTPVQSSSQTQLPGTNSEPTQSQAFDTAKIIQTGLIGPDNELLYVKDGDVWKYDLTRKRASKLLDVKDDIQIFSLSSEKTWMAYGTVRRTGDQSERTMNNGFSDTIILYNRFTNNSREIYSLDVKAEPGIWSLAFTPDDKKLLFTNNAIRIYDINSGIVSEYSISEASDFCSAYSVESNAFSPKSNRVIIWELCYEGGRPLIFDLDSGTIIRDFGQRYIEGGNTPYVFIDNDTLLGIDSSVISGEPPSAFGSKGYYMLYSLNEDGDTRLSEVGFGGEVEESSLATIVGISNDGIVVGGTLGDFRYYDGETETLKPLEGTRPIFAVSSNSVGSQELWVTNTDFTSPVLLEEIPAGSVRETRLVQPR